MADDPMARTRRRKRPLAQRQQQHGSSHSWYNRCTILAITLLALMMQAAHITVEATHAGEIEVKKAYQDLECPIMCSNLDLKPGIRVKMGTSTDMLKKGMIGTVPSCSYYGAPNTIVLVEWDNFDSGHDGNGFCACGATTSETGEAGWWVKCEDLKLVLDGDQNVVQKSIIAAICVVVVGLMVYYGKKRYDEENALDAPIEEDEEMYPRPRRVEPIRDMELDAMTAMVNTAPDAGSDKLPAQPGAGYRMVQPHSPPILVQKKVQL